MTTIRDLLESGKITLDTVVLGELPMTADGAVVGQGPIIYMPVSNGIIQWVAYLSAMSPSDAGEEPSISGLPNRCYSTLAAAEAARSKT